MIKLLSKLFIKDYKNYFDPQVRVKYGTVFGIFGVFLNFLLFTAKVVSGFLFSSVSMIADGFNNLSDAASSIVEILGFKLSSKKPDPDHPFGHGRIEYISGLIISFFILIMGFELIKTSVKNLIKPSLPETGLVSILILLVCVLIKFYMYFYNRYLGKKINSVAMIATSKDSLSDVFSTLIVILANIFSKFTTFPLDGLAGCVVGIFILKTGIESAVDTMKPLLGTHPSSEFVDRIEAEVLSHPPILGMHDLIVHDYGPGRVMISLHAEVPGDMNVFEIHDVIDNVEMIISKKLNCSCVIHMDPIDTKNERLQELKLFLKTELSKISEGLNCHDVRMVPGPTHTNLIFDVVKPFNCPLEDDFIKASICKAVNTTYKDINCVITVETPFV